MAVLPLEQHTVLITGEVPGLDRHAALAAVQRLGGVASGALSGRVDLLVVGGGAGRSKLRRAAELGLRQLTAEAFAALVADPASWDGCPPGAVPEPPSAAVEATVAVLTGAHTPGSCSWTRDGHYVTIVTCRCGWREESDRFTDARAAHHQHRLSAADPDLEAEASSGVDAVDGDPAPGRGGARG